MLYYTTVVRLSCNQSEPVATGCNRNWLRPVAQPLRTAQDRTGPVPAGPVRFFTVFEIVRTGLGPGPAKKGQKTGPDRTFEH
jgi:hypothetical protein